MDHEEDEHETVQRAERRVRQRRAKKRRRMPVSGKSVFVLNRLLRKRANARRSTWRKKHKH